MPPVGPVLLQAHGDEEDHEDDHADDRDGAVLSVKIRLGALLHRRGDLLHLVVARRQGEEPADQHHAVDDGDEGAEDRDQHRVFRDPGSHVPLLSFRRTPDPT